MNILVITSIYPGEGTPSGYTPVVHYFVREWVKLGYNVRVIHTCTYFPKIYYSAPNWIKKIIQNKIGIALPEQRLNKELEYEYEGVKVYRIPMWKLMPMSNYTVRVLNNACNKVGLYIKKKNFQPEQIISHWVNPQLVLMSYLKRKTGATTTMVLHGAEAGMEKTFNNWKQLTDDVDIWGYRSLKTKETFETLYGVPRFAFRCFSGIPQNYTNNVPKRDGIFRLRFVQVGMLLERKHPDKAIEAIVAALGNTAYCFNIIGEGTMHSTIESQIKHCGVQDKIHLLGRIPRNEVMKVLDDSDVFILISEDEVFGLAYIEAMARGCIVIASRGEGMEGIIKDGENGFLCTAGNTEELKEIILRINNLTQEKRRQISENAIGTSLKLTDVAVAKDYIKTVENYSREMKSDESVSKYHAMFGGIQPNKK